MSMERNYFSVLFCYCSHYSNVYEQSFTEILTCRLIDFNTTVHHLAAELFNLSIHRKAAHQWQVAVGLCTAFFHVE